MTRRPSRDETQKEATTTIRARQIKGRGGVTRPGNPVVLWEMERHVGRCGRGKTA